MRIATPLTSNPKKLTVLTQCVMRTRAVCRGASAASATGIERCARDGADAAMFEVMLVAETAGRITLR